MLVASLQVCPLNAKLIPLLVLSVLGACVYYQYCVPLSISSSLLQGVMYYIRKPVVEHHMLALVKFRFVLNTNKI